MRCRPRSPPGVAHPPFEGSSTFFCSHHSSSPFVSEMLLNIAGCNCSTVAQLTVNRRRVQGRSLYVCVPQFAAYRSCQTTNLYSRSRFKHLRLPSFVHILPSQQNLAHTKKWREKLSASHLCALQVLAGTNYMHVDQLLGALLHVPSNTTRSLTMPLFFSTPNACVLLYYPAFLG